MVVLHDGVLRALDVSTDGVDVYAGCAKDYTRMDVNRENLLAVLTGNKTAVRNVGSGRVVESNSTSNIFFFYSDHGAHGAIFMPTGQHLYADVLNQTLSQMYEQKLYNEVVIYLEACASGSMFEGVLPNDIGIYAVSASNSTESSWATYCPSYYYLTSPYDVANPLPNQLDTCMGDLFSVSWMQDTAIGNVFTETLHEQYAHVRNITSPSGMGTV